MHPVIKYGCFVAGSLCAAIVMAQAQGKASKADEMFIKDAMQGDLAEVNMGNWPRKRPKVRA
jgi:hypothetical protein